MSEKIVIGEGFRLDKDVPDLMDWLEKRVGKRSKQVIDMVFLPLLVGEIEILMVKKHWCYDEPIDEAMVAVKVMVKQMASAMFKDFMSDETD